MLDVAQTICFFVLVFVSAASDLTRRKIGNGPVLAAACAGLALGGLQGWADGVGAEVFMERLGGGFVALGIGFIFFWFGGLGAGDAKLMAALGALTSMRFVMWMLAYTSVFGFVLAVGMVAWRRNWGEAFGGALKSDRRERRREIADPESPRTVPYGLAVCAGALTTVGRWMLVEGALPW